MTEEFIGIKEAIKSLGTVVEKYFVETPEKQVLPTKEDYIKDGEARFTNGQIAYINSVVNGVVQSRINNYVKNYDNIIDSALKSMRGIKYDANDLDDSVEELKGNDLRIEGLVIELRNRTIALESQQKETKDIDYSYRLITDARLKSLESKTLY